ncbi:flagellar basal body rod protein FlgB [Woodsholea maritima]|uniref:flagellar basal body rod protein FlgB n=1 Tax=Woodsholea maritima TaxID=240237 RepID=UPI000375A893|nr:hypothetical protein [Woodsholea maritima]
MESLTSAILQKAIDGLHLRQTYIANNIANINSEGYQPQTVNFESALSLAAAAKDIQQVKASGYTIEARPNSEIRPDLELAESSQTALRYGALITILSKHMALNHALISSGAR